MADKQVLYGEVTAFYALSLPEFHMPFHSHSSFEIMYITAGSCTIFCGEESFQVGAGRFVGGSRPFCFYRRSGSAQTGNQPGTALFYFESGISFFL